MGFFSYIVKGNYDSILILWSDENLFIYLFY